MTAHRLTAHAPDPLIHIPARLPLMVTLATVPHGDTLPFTRLQDNRALDPVTCPGAWPPRDSHDGRTRRIHARAAPLLDFGAELAISRLAVRLAATSLVKTRR